MARGRGLHFHINRPRTQCVMGDPLGVRQGYLGPQDRLSFTGKSMPRYAKDISGKHEDFGKKLCGTLYNLERGMDLERHKTSRRKEISSVPHVLTGQRFSLLHLCTLFCDRIPSCVQGRGKLPDLQIKVLLAPIQEDFFSGLFAIQKLGKNKWSGPLYQLRFIQEEHAEEEKLGESQVLVNPLPVETIRVKAHNMMLNPITEAVKTIAFLYCPENEPVRVRVPIKYINEEKCPGLREGGWLNRVQQCVDINVAPFTEPPLFATQDVGGMGLKDRKTIGDLKFKGKGNACVAVLPPDTMATIISKI